jgi:hypothetical protein
LCDSSDAKMLARHDKKMIRRLNYLALKLSFAFLESLKEIENQTETSKYFMEEPSQFC